MSNLIENLKEKVEIIIEQNKQNENRKNKIKIKKRIRRVCNIKNRWNKESRKNRNRNINFKRKNNSRENKWFRKIWNERIRSRST